MMAMTKRIFSGIRPSGDLHIGNYIGAVKQWLKLQDEYEMIAGIVDMHAITTPHQPEELRGDTLETAMIYLAAGLNPKRTILAVQSHVPAHAELAWILGTMTPLGELERMTQFKEKGREAKTREGVMAGLFNYPVLMAADILIYQSEVVPVGEDQVQHVELARSLAERFNNRYGRTFTLPKPLIHKESARIMSLANPQKKMSKSDLNPKSYIRLVDSPKTIREKIKSAATDSGKDIIYNPTAKPAISNLLVIFSEFSGKSIAALEKEYNGRDYAGFKSDLAEAVIAGLKPLQNKLEELKKDEKQVLEILQAGAEKASAIAEKTLIEVKRKIGFLSL